jgi:DNA-directed RNA polymerase subunit N (RpoN/RPB10)
MIIPIRCFTCGKVIAGKWKRYQERVQELELKAKKGDPESQNEEAYKNLEPNYKGAILDELGLQKICCRRHILTHVDLVDII